MYVSTFAKKKVYVYFYAYLCTYIYMKSSESIYSELIFLNGRLSEYFYSCFLLFFPKFSVTNIYYPNNLRNDK